LRAPYAGHPIQPFVNVAASGLGWKSFLNTGDSTGTFGLAAGGSFITSPATTVALSSLMNFNAITGVPTLGGIVLGPNVGQNALNVSGSSGTQSTLTATNTGTATSQTTPGFNFLESESYASFSSSTTHFGFVEQARASSDRTQLARAARCSS
jgi:hypothetical protein